MTTTKPWGSQRMQAKARLNVRFLPVSGQDERGNMDVIVYVQVPEELDDAERHLFEHLRVLTDRSSPSKEPLSGERQASPKKILNNRSNT